jgi:hypothetical protein
MVLRDQKVSTEAVYLSAGYRRHTWVIYHIKAAQLLHSRAVSSPVRSRVKKLGSLGLDRPPNLIQFTIIC